MKRYEFVIHGETFAVEVESVGLRDAFVVVNGKRYEVRITKGMETAVSVAPPSAPVAAVPRAPAPRGAAAASLPAPAGGGAIAAPLPGLILEVPVAVGDTVGIGDIVVRMEAMKMENDVKTARAGVVSEVRVKKGDEVQVGQVMVVIEPSL